MNNRKPNREIIAIVTITTFGIFLFSYVAFMVFQDKLPSSLLTIWNRWDTAHYLDIAERGYTNATIGERHLRIVFFPFYPFLIRHFNLIFNDYMLSALAVSNLAYVIAVFYLYKLILLDYAEETALRAVFYFSIFPTAYFLHAGYTESLFSALTISSFYYSRKERWWLAGLVGMLASATRITGIILLPALILEYLSQKDFQLKSIKKDIIWLTIIPIGFISYLVINQLTFEEPLKFLEFQKGHWSKTLAFPWEGVSGAWKAISGRPPTYRILVGWAEFIFGVLGYILTLWALFIRLRPSYIFYMIATWLILTSTSYMLSTPRYALSVFPVFIVLSLLGKREEVNYLITFLSIMFLALFLAHFSLGRWAF